jgi:ribosomal protein S18 acetylase RimI-like enzyme
MAVDTQLEILDLRHFSARQLRPLLETEARVWEQQLRWNYQSSTELLLQYLDSRILPGFVALDRGRVCGFTFCVYEGHKAVVGDAYAIADDPSAALNITHTLLRPLLDLLLHSPNISRIESQLLLYSAGSIEEPFFQAGFVMYPRLYMEYDFPRAKPESVIPADKPTFASTLPPHIELCRWSPAHYQPAAELIHESYIGHIDALINDQYCSLHGSLRFLHNIVRFPGCGVFDADQSWVLRDKKNGSLIGMVLCSRVAENVAHITQLCIATAYRGHKFGSSLLKHCLSHLAASGFAAITLTVTEANTQAVQLYENLGFFTRHRFDAMVLDKTQMPSSQG